MATEKEQLLCNFGEWITFITDLAHYNERFWNQSVALGKWSVREVAAHILRWDEYFYEEAILKVQAGLPLTVKHLHYDEFNEKAKTYGKSTSIVELVREAISIRERIIDTIAHLTDEQYGAAYVDADGHAFEAGQYLKDFIWHDRHHLEQIKRMLHFRIEEMSLNGWPALQTVVYDGWLLRLAEGYTKRSNSINPVFGHTLGLDAKIRSCEELYECKGVRSVFKITPFIQPTSLDEELASRGYELIDRTIVMTIHLSEIPSPSHADIWLEQEATESWLDAAMVFNQLSDEQRSTTRKMLEQSPLVKCCAILHDNGIPVACGYGVIEDGWIGLYDIVTDPNYRNRGFGEQLVLHLLQWGKERGATEGYLLVVKDNAAANRLYDKIGYVPQYEYWYRAKK
ncbi:GNAT family N-acetyltransferase [Bacillus sp. FJAT-28004]|uniref:GNAT family N-acetyltransferase n=1 Tax=Bacillus sp. FJAT-28004 TaxID=1679165 RepID=UPI0009EB9519|nr:GNAT family N-acetyltransferase [Bacillus sp. FJAT-28004]